MSLHEVTSSRHLVTHALSDCWQSPSKTAPFSVGHRLATRAFAAEQKTDEGGEAQKDHR